MPEHVGRGRKTVQQQQHRTVSGTGFPVENLESVSLNNFELEVSEPDAPAALETVRNLRHAWKTTLEQIMAGHGVQPQFIQQLNRILCLDTFSETLGVEGKIGFHLHRSRSLLAGGQLALAILARSIAEFLATAEFKYLRRCANTDSCTLVFYDATKNHRRQWCSNSMCGNRYKVAEFRRRQRTGRRMQRV